MPVDSTPTAVKRLPRIPLTIVCTLNGAETDGVLVAVMDDELDALESRLAAAEAERDAAWQREDVLVEALIDVPEHYTFREVPAFGRAMRPILAAHDARQATEAGE